MASTIPVNLSDDHLQSLAASRPLQALAEVIWNGLDADAKRVEIQFSRNKLDAIETIRVVDDGGGIDYDQAATYFGNLGDSWKKGQNRTKGGRGLHGKNGRGRFRAFSLGAFVTWRTTSARQNGGLISYRIAGSITALKSFDVSDPSAANSGTTAGTDVLIEELHKEFGSLGSPKASLDATREFAGYLAQHPDVVIEYDGTVLDPKAMQDRTIDLLCEEITLADGKKVRPTVRVIEWKLDVERSLHFCDASGISLHEIKLGTGVRAPGFHFTAYLLDDVVRELDKENKLVLEDLHPDIKALVDTAKKSLKAYFRRREAESLADAVARWKEEKIYPYEDSADLSPAEEAERQVFDIVAINVEEYLPDFDSAKPQSRRFTFKLLSQALKENPDSVQKIISEVLNLKKEDQDELAQLLDRTPLSKLIQASKIVADRLNFLLGLENLVCDSDTKKSFLERDQLHKILEKEAWIFNEEFTLAGSEQRLEEVLQKHLELLGKREDDPDPIEVSEGKACRVDLMFCKASEPRTEEFDYLIVELKRPSKKIDHEVMTQVERYAFAVANDERFHGLKIRWTFLAVSTGLDAFATQKTSFKEKPKGLSFESSDGNVTVWAKPWSTVISDARARLRFFREQLAYVADRDSARDYLERAHSKFLPQSKATETQF